MTAGRGKEREEEKIIKGSGACLDAGKSGAEAATEAGLRVQREGKRSGLRGSCGGGGRTVSPSHPPCSPCSRVTVEMEL